MYSALNIIVNGLGAQTFAFNNISSNVANVHSDSYKEVDTHFKPLVSESIHFGNGVKAYRVNTIEVQGQLRDTGIDTNIAIDGKGMFAVSNSIDDEEILFTRLGSFDKDKQGYLVNGEGAYLKGWKLDKDEVDIFKSASLDHLKNINLDKIGDEASATTEVTISMNLDAREEVPRGEEYEIKPQSTYNADNSLHDLIYPDKIKAGDSFSISTSDGITKSFTYGGFISSNVISKDNSILGAQSIYGDFAALRDGDQFILNTNASGDVALTYSKYNADPHRGYFNNMSNLCEAIDLRKEYSARLVDGQIYIAPQDGAQSMTFKNVVVQQEVIGMSADVSNIYKQDQPTPYLNSYVMDQSSPIYEATNPRDKFQNIQNGEEINIALSNGQNYTFKFDNINADDNTFNSLATLAAAIDKTDLAAAIINDNQLKVEIDKQRFPDVAIMSCNGSNALAARLGVEIDSTFKDGLAQGDSFAIALGAHNNVIAQQQFPIDRIFNHHAEINGTDIKLPPTDKLPAADGEKITIMTDDGSTAQFVYKQSVVPDPNKGEFDSLYGLK